MGEPRRTGRKGGMLRCQRIASTMFRDWCPHRSNWQPTVDHRRAARAHIAEMRKALDAWEATL